MRIYLDTNIYSNLRNGQLNRLEQMLSNIKENHSFYYSQAHLMDLYNDRTNQKYSDLEYMERFVENHFFSKYFRKQTSMYLAAPCKAFKDYLNNMIIEEQLDFSSVEGPLDEVTQVNIDILKTTLDETLDLHKNDLPEWQKSFYFDLVQCQSQSDLIKATQEYLLTFKQKENFREIRKYFYHHKSEIFAGLESLEFSEGKVSSNKRLDMQLDKMVEDNILEVDGIEINKFIMYFMFLNFFSIDKEKNAKAAFTNLINDAWHCYYAGSSDVFITEDVGCKYKAEILYDKYNIDTIVLSSNQFIDFYNPKRFPSINNNSNFIINLNQNTQKDILSDNQQSIKIFKLNDFFFNYLNYSQLEENENGEIGIIFRQTTHRTFLFSTLCDLKNIIEEYIKCINFLGTDSLFDINQIMGEIENKNWTGISYTKGNMIFYICMDYDSGMISITLIFNKETQPPNIG